MNIRQHCFVSIVALLLLAVFGMVEVAEGQTRNRVDHRGKEFRIAFLHTNGDGEFPTYYLVVGAENPTAGTITYENTGRRENISIFAANTPIRIRLDTFDLLLPDPTTGPEISRNTITVRFNDEVTLYGINTLRWSSDAFLGLPVEAVGQNYTIMSYPNTVEPSPAGQVLDVADFPSQFAVIGTENNTEVTVRPTVPVNGRRNTVPFTVRINAGEVFFAQARDNPNFDPAAGRDLTGTIVETDKPVVVLGSHQRTNIPWNDAVGRDHLVEQLPSTDNWETRAMVTPHFQLEKTIDDANFVRVIAAQPGTVLTIDSTSSQALPVGSPVEIPLNRAMLLTANKPIQVAQFQHSTVDVEFISLPNDTVGDPFMMLIPSREQFDSAYTFESWNTKDFLFHYINVVIPTERISSLRLDGRPLVANFTRINKTSYSYAQIPMSAGGHHISARVPFGLYIYGYGPYNSYGAPGGMIFDSLFKDHIEPDIAWRDTCGGAVGAAFDTGTSAFGMEDLRLLTGSRNLELETDPFNPGDDSIRFRLNLIDPFQDGFAQMLAVDTGGLDRRYDFPVKGFTVALATGETPVRLDTLASLNGLEFCQQISLRNYGQFPQEIEDLTFDQQIPGLRVDATLPITLLPGETRTVRVCYQRTGDTTAIVDLSLDNGCLKRKLATLPLLSGIDSLKPSLVRLTDTCDQNVIYEATERYASNSGIKSIAVVLKDNAEILIPSPSDLPGREARIEIRRQSIWEDVVYQIEITDVVGNTIILSDTIGGLTLRITDASRSSEFGFRLDPAVPWKYDDLIFSQEDCDVLWFENTGLKTLDLYRLRLSGNLEFSVPPEQLPLLLAPGERRPVEVCVRPRSIGDYHDTLIIEFFCNSLIKVVDFQTLVDPLSGDGHDRCGNLMQFNVEGFTRRNFLESPVPNPVSKEVAELTFGLSEPQPVTLTLHDRMGNEVRRFLNHDHIDVGIVKIQARVGDLSSGQYFLRMQAGENESIVRPLIIRQ